MNQKTPEKPYQIPRIIKALDEWAENKKELAIMGIDSATDLFRRRTREIGICAGAIAYILEGHKETKVAIQFAIWVAEYVLYYQMKFFGKEMNKSADANDKILRSSGSLNTNKTVFSRLGVTFSNKEVGDEQLSLGLNGKSYRETIKRWIKEGFVVKIPNTRDEFRKTELGIRLCEELKKQEEMLYRPSKYEEAV